jgi:hypothetical protein
MEAVGRSRNSTALQLGRTTVVAGTPASGANTERPADQPRLGTTSRTPSPGSPRQCVASDATRLQPSRTRSRPVSFSWFEAIGCCLAHSHLDHAGHGVREALEQLPAERATGSVDGDNPVGDLDRDSLEGVDLLLEARSRSARTSSSPRAIRRSGSRRATMPDHPVASHHRDRLQVMPQQHPHCGGRAGVLSQVCTPTGSSPHGRCGARAFWLPSLDQALGRAGRPAKAGRPRTRCRPAGLLMTSRMRISHSGHAA